jgi:predicted restriction endonuclease
MSIMCPVCNKEIIRKKYDSRNIQHFCSKRCSAIYNNKHFPKRASTQPKLVCKVCGKKVTSKDLCKSCFNTTRRNETLQYTLGQVRDLYKDKNSMALAAKLRGYGYSIYIRSDRPKKCVVCGYDKHYEVSHIRPVSSFPDTATMAEVHDLNNLVALCPNCHWEFDHFGLDISKYIPL